MYSHKLHRSDLTEIAHNLLIFVLLLAKSVIDVQVTVTVELFFMGKHYFGLQVDKYTFFSIMCPYLNSPYSPFF